MLLPLLLLLTPSTITSVSFCDQENWNIVWSDDFDTLDLKNTWTIDLGGNDSKVRDSQGTVENVYIQNISKTNSVLVLRSQRQQSKNYNYTSGAINSQNKQFWKGPARVCVNAMLPGRPFSSNSNGVWPAHWLMPNTKACWPSNGEIDIMEMINGDGVLHGTYHWSPNCSNCNCTNLQLGGQTKITGDWNATWHEYAVEYTNDWIAFVLDSKVYSNITRGMKHKGVPAAFYDVPYYLILNTAVGGPWPKPVDASTTFPLYHYIDYVHVSKPK